MVIGCFRIARLARVAALAASLATWVVSGVGMAAGVGPMLDDAEEDVPVGTEPEGSEMGVGEAQALQSELAPSDAELRTRFVKGVALGVGQTAPWQQYSVSGYWHWRPDVALTFQVGAGKFGFLRTKNGTTYDLNVRSEAPVVGVRAYLNESVAVFVEGMAGWGLWRGDLSPSSGTTAASAKVSSNFNAHGPFVGAAVGLVNWWENGLFLEYQFIGTSKAFVLSNTADNDAAREVINGEIESASSWGLLNVKFGWFF